MVGKGGGGGQCVMKVGVSVVGAFKLLYPISSCLSIVDLVSYKMLY